MPTEVPADDADGQPALLPREAARAELRRAKPRAATAADAAVDPVAQVLVDLPLAHLDRPFDYAVPQKYADTAVPGARVKVRFAGQDVDGFVVGRTPSSDHPGRLQQLRRVVSAEPVLTPEVAELSALVAARQAGTRADVLRLAVPPRHAATERQPSPPSPAVEATPDTAVWEPYAGGSALIEELAAGGSPRVVCSALPGDQGAVLLAEAVVATARAGRGVLVCVPDRRDVARLDRVLTGRLGPGRHVVLTADAGPAKRYRSFLAAARGASRIVIGTRAAAFAPVADLGLVAIWDDGDDLHDEPRAPYPHARDVLLLRARQTGCAALVGGHARSVEAQYLVRTGWAREIAAPREVVRSRVTVAVTGDSAGDLARDPRARSARLPREVFEVIRAALTRGPVLVQAPRAGYATRLLCDRCRCSADCARCRGPLRITAADRPPECAWCGTPAPGWACSECGGRGLRAPVLGDRRTAEELGRAFPNVPVRTSSGDHVLDEVASTPALVVATPGAEPVADGGYAAVLLLDTWLPLGRPDLRAAEEAVRRWANAAALVAAPDRGRVLAVGAPSHPALQALVRWDPAGFAEREIADRQSAHLPPASRAATVAGDPEEVAAALEDLALPPGAEVLGPVAVPDQPRGRRGGHPEDDEAEQVCRYVVRVPRAAGADLAAALRVMQGTRSARKLAHLRVELDPTSLG
ncbi:primosomal protein N' [Nocardioides terrisoli]|uniref:primosomal protein N' n=1 Tax=Nocardioides terrisoli TaxID=3388267 RepID=UPI00287BA840|nr:primosomal protein N' [Nocardioides marmorisolisilvae]